MGSGIDNPGRHRRPLQQYGTAWWEFPRLFMWHATFDGTWFCNCTRSREFKEYSKKWQQN